MRCWRPFPVVLSLLSGCMTSNAGSPPAEEAPGDSTSAQESAPWELCLPTAVPRGPAPDAVDPASREWVHAGGALFFIAEDPRRGLGLWTSRDGQGADSFLLKRFEPEPTGLAPSELTRVGNRVFFVASDAKHGRELWMSDGAASGTRVVKDLWPGETGSFPRSLFELNGLLYFAASTPEHGRELWRSDGTPEGTVLVEDLEPGPEGTSPDRLTRGGDGALYYLAHLEDFTVLMRSEGGPRSVELFRVPAEGAVLESLTPVGKRLFFVAGDMHEHGAGLNVTDGKAVMHLGMFMGVTDLVALGGKLYFTAAAEQGSHDLELWRTDGTPRGTWRVKDVRTGPEGSSPRGLTVVGRRLFFSADDGVHGREPWVSDGTDSGTQLLADLVPGAGGSSPEELTALQGNLFFSADTPGHGREPWVSSGTPGGTRALDEVARGALSSGPRGFVRSGWEVFFSAEDGTGAGRRLWSVPLRPGNRCKARAQ